MKSERGRPPAKHLKDKKLWELRNHKLKLLREEYKRVSLVELSEEKKISSGLMVANLIATILIIAIHYTSKGHLIQLTEIGGWNYLFQEFITNGIARIAVPFFALFFGYFMAL